MTKVFDRAPPAHDPFPDSCLRRASGSGQVDGEVPCDGVCAMYTEIARSGPLKLLEFLSDLELYPSSDLSLSCHRDGHYPSLTILLKWCCGGFVMTQVGVGLQGTVDRCLLHQKHQVHMAC